MRFLEGSESECAFMSVRQSLRIFPQDLPNKPGVAAFVTKEVFFAEVFAKPPQERGMSVDAVSYEELQQLYHGAARYKRTLFGLVGAINQGRCSAAAVEMMGGGLLIGLAKPDGGTRPIGIGAAMRRLSGRVVMAQEGAAMGRIFTETAPTGEMLEAAGHACCRPAVQRAAAARVRRQGGS